MPTYIETNDETKPAGNRARSLGDDDIREFKRTIRERLATDHNFKADETGDTQIGYHKQVTFIEAANIGTGATGLPILGAQTVSGKPELTYTDEDNNDVQITSNGFAPVRVGEVQTIAGVKTFSSSPIVPTPTTDMQAATKKYGDDTFPVKAAVNSRITVLATSQVVGTSNISTNSGTYATISEMTTTFTTYGTKMFVKFSAPFNAGGNAASGNIRLKIDGTVKITTFAGANSVYGGPYFSEISWLETGLTPGSHTVLIEWAWVSGGDSLYQSGTTHGPRVLTCIDLD